MEYRLEFDPKTIEHLGVKMYSTLPPALAELISNAYDADASQVKISFHENEGKPESIIVKDNGCGMSSEDIRSKFLVIGRNRRELGDEPTPKYHRLPTGKKGLGKLALFGLANRITVDTVKANKRSSFVLDWNKLMSSGRVYKPHSEIQDMDTSLDNGTSITLKELKRKSAFDLESIADTLSRMFIVDSTFQIILQHGEGTEIAVTNERRYQQIEKEFLWNETDIDPENFGKNKGIEFNLITGKKPIPPSSGLRGITIFSRGKLVNSPEFFSDSTSSNFYQYLTGWIKADFIDLLDEDVISTNRQSINWEHEEMIVFRDWLTKVVAKTRTRWRKEKRQKKTSKFKDETGIDKDKWLGTLPKEIKRPVETIISELVDDDGTNESFNSVVHALHALAPEYPHFHWRNLHGEIADISKQEYINKDYHAAFFEAVKQYCKYVRGQVKDTNYNYDDMKDYDLMGKVFGRNEGTLKVTSRFLENNTNFSPQTLVNIEESQRQLSQGVVQGGRNVVAHEVKKVLSSSGLFSEKDCLDLLSLLSYLVRRVESACKHEDRTVD